MAASTTTLPVSSGTAAFRTYTNSDSSVGALHGLELAGVPVSAAVPLPVSAQGTTTVAGTVSFVGTPAVAVAFPATQAVSLAGTQAVAGAVSITGTPTVTISNPSSAQPLAAGSNTIGAILLPAGTMRAPAGATTIPASAAGTFQALFSANSIAIGAFVQNPASSGVTLTVDASGTTGTTRSAMAQDIPPGQTWNALARYATAVTVSTTGSITFNAGVTS